MNLLRLAAAASFAFLAAAGPVAAADCRLAPPQIVVETPEVGVDIQDVRTVIDYTAFPWQTQNRLAPGWSINGLTVARSNATTRIEGLSGPGCYAVTRIVVSMTYEDPVKVYVADKYPRGTCQHSTILAHEMQHVDIFRRGRAIYAQRMREMLSEALRVIGDAGESRTQTQIGDTVETVMREFTTALGAAHGAIDTVENYRATQALCPAW